MQTVGAFEAKTHFSALLEKVENGEQILITKHGRAIAKLVPTTRSNGVRTKQAIDALKALSHSTTLDLDWKKLRDQGRR